MSQTCRFAIALAASFLAAGCTLKEPHVVEPPPPEVVVARPLLQNVTDYFEFTGNTDAVEQVEVRARVSGYITKVLFEDGQEVKAGEMLIQIDDRPYQAALDKAKAEVARAKAASAKAKADLARSEQLLPARAISREEYDLKVAEAAIAEAAIQGAEADVREAELNLEFTKVTSPIDGRTSKVAVTEGNLVQSGPGGATVLTTIVSIDPIYVYFDVDERSLLRYQELSREGGKDARPDRLKTLKHPVLIGLANEDGFPHEGILDFADNRVDPQTGTIRCRAVLLNAQRRFAPGMFTRVRMPFGAPRKALLVVDRAIGADQSRKYLLCVDNDGLVQSKDVKLGTSQGTLRVIEAGISPTDRVIISGIQRARPAMKVASHEAPMPVPPSATPPAAAKSK